MTPQLRRFPHGAPEAGSAVYTPDELRDAFAHVEDALEAFPKTPGRVLFPVGANDYVMGWVFVARRQRFRLWFWPLHNIHDPGRGDGVREVDDAVLQFAVPYLPLLVHALLTAQEAKPKDALGQYNAVYEAIDLTLGRPSLSP